MSALPDLSCIHIRADALLRLYRQHSKQNIPRHVVLRYLNVEDDLSGKIKDGETLDEENVWKALRFAIRWRKQSETLFLLYGAYLTNMLAPAVPKGELCSQCMIVINCSK